MLNRRPLSGTIVAQSRYQCPVRDPLVRPAIADEIAGMNELLLDRLARSLRDASDIVDELTAKGVKLNIGGSVHDPLDPVGHPSCRRGPAGAAELREDGVPEPPEASPQS
jgi:hypothetical protein